MKDTQANAGYTAKCFSPKPMSGVRWTWSCKIDGIDIYFVENTSMIANEISQKALEQMLLVKLGFEVNATNLEHFFPGGKPTLELMDRLHQLVDPPAQKDDDDASSVRV